MRYKICKINIVIGLRFYKFYVLLVLVCFIRSIIGIEVYGISFNLVIIKEMNFGGVTS